MRIGMKKTFHQDLVQVGVKQLFSQGFTVELKARQRTHLSDFLPGTYSIVSTREVQ
jgi:hypothetical protein